jgi:peptide methionine sulfoxide reductase MsrB
VRHGRRKHHVQEGARNLQNVRIFRNVTLSLTRANEKYNCSLHSPVQDNLRWGCDTATADRICNFNRHYAEHSGYFESTKFIQEAKNAGGEITFYDSNTGMPLFVAPRGRSLENFLMESRAHGWPSFRDEEVIWENVRCLSDGETVSLAGTHLGHNLPDKKGSRYCINLVSVAGNPNTEF